MIVKINNTAIDFEKINLSLTGQSNGSQADIEIAELPSASDLSFYPVTVDASAGRLFNGFVGEVTINQSDVIKTNIKFIDPKWTLHILDINGTFTGTVKQIIQSIVNASGGLWAIGEVLFELSSVNVS